MRYLAFSDVLSRVLVLVGLSFAVAPARAFAAGAPPAIVHPIYAQMPDASQNARVHDELVSVTGRYDLKPVETLTVETPPPPKTAAALKDGAALVQKLAFGDARARLDAAAAEAATTGGATLSTSELSDLYIDRAMAIAKADWKPARAVDEATRTRAYEDYVRAATLTPERALNSRDVPPQVIEDWQRATAEVKGRPKGTVVVHAMQPALVSLDGRPPVPGSDRGAAFADLPFGEHLVSVDEPGRAPWGTVVLVNAPSTDVTLPARAALTLDDAVAAAHARRMGAKFALVAELALGEGEPQIELRLVDTSGIRHDSTRLPVAAEGGTFDAAVIRLQDEARRIDHLGLAPGGSESVASASEPTATPGGPALLTAPPPAKRPTFRDDPGGWTRDHWPLVTTAGVMATATVLLLLTLGNDGSRR